MDRNPHDAVRYRATIASSSLKVAASRTIADLLLQGVNAHDWRTELVEKNVLQIQIRVSYAEHGARDNPWMESFWGRFKTENRGLIWETESLSELTEIIEGRIAYYNLNRRHSTLGQIPPWKFLCRTLTSIIDTGANITQPS